jgi:hypothetical protein
MTRSRSSSTVLLRVMATISLSLMRGFMRTKRRTSLLPSRRRMPRASPLPRSASLIFCPIDMPRICA